MKGFPIRRAPSESVSEAAMAVAKRQAEQLTLVRRRAQPAAVYITRMTLTAVFAYVLALQLPGGSVRSVLAPLTALLVVQATLFHTIRSAVQRVIGVTTGVLAAVAVSAYIPFSWWVLGLLIAGTLALGLMLRLHEDMLEVPISAMLIFSVDSHAAATSRITETLIGAAAGLAAGLLFAPLRVQPAKDAIGELSRQMGDLLGQMADGLAEGPDPRRAAEWLDRTRALRGEIERVDDALSQAEESVRLNPRRLRYPNHPNPAAGLRDGVDTLERAATDLRVLARAVADSARLDSEDSPVNDPETRTRLAAVIAELAASVRAYGQLVETEPLDAPDAQAEPIGDVLEDHLEEALRKQDRLADVLATDPAKQPDGWPLRGEILAHVDRLRSELEPRRPTPPDEKRRAPRMPHHRSRTAPPRRGYRAVVRSRAGRAVVRSRAGRAVVRSRAGRTAERVRARLRVLAARRGVGLAARQAVGLAARQAVGLAARRGVGLAARQAVVGGPWSTRRTMGSACSRSSHMHSAHQVAPACASGPTRSAAAAGAAGLMPDMTRSNGSPSRPIRARWSCRNPWISRTVAASGCRGLPPSPGSMIGIAPSQRAARRIGGRAGHSPPTQTGTRGRCTGVGRNVTSSMTTCSPRKVTGSPDHSRLSAVRPSSRRAASSFRSVVSPKLPNSSGIGAPRPTPRIIRPPVSRSRVVTSRASFCTRRRATGVIIVPSRIRSVASAAAVSSTHGSAIVRRSALRCVMWSQTNSPSQPACSARRARSASTLGSAKSPKFGTSTAKRMIVVPRLSRA
jgi:uncharacterized membrane protein YgaE (UPF0421/DUF939 family)